MAIQADRNQPAPDFTLPDGEGRPVRLAEHRGKNVVLVFYPADWSPVCTGELALFQETIEEIRGLDAEVLGISTDQRYSHQAWARHQRLSFRLLSDFWPHGEVSRRYGVFDEGSGFSRRSLFFIDGEGVLRDSWIAERPDIAPGIGLVLGTLERIQGKRHEEVSHA